MSQSLQLEVLKTDLLTEPLEYAVLEPSKRTDQPLVLLYVLHGGGGDRKFLEQMRPALERAWNEGELPPAIALTPSAGRSFYMDTRDGVARYESAILGPLTERIVADYGVSTKREHTAALGISMGGMGALRLGLKHPTRFAAIAALEPGIEPVLDFADISVEDRFYRDDSLYEAIYGAPVDPAYWRANNPASIVVDQAGDLVKTAPEILIECGDLDSFNLHRGAEFLHRILSDRGIPHEYHLVRGADHLGRTLPRRFVAAIRFLGEVLNPPGPDEGLVQFHAVINQMRTRAGLPPVRR
jgi:S-formylglutathione hydrolase